MVASAMFCGVAPRLPELYTMGPPAVFVSWLSFSRWFVECLYVEETVRIGGDLSMP